MRLEDTDRDRIVAGSAEQLYQCFHWLGIQPDEGPIWGGSFGPYRQSERLSLYQKYAQELVEGGFAYYCFCSEQRLRELRQEQQAQGLPPKYDGRCKKTSNIKEQKAKIQIKNQKYVVRLNVPGQGETSFQDIIRGEIKFRNELLDDQVLLKSDGFPTYHLAVVVDDHLMQISHVIRAEEWISSTPKHVLLYQALGWELPQFAHLPLLRNPDHSKLSKRKNPVSVLWYKEQGFLPEALINYLALMGWSHPEGKEVFDLQEFIEKFDLKRIDPAGPIFDLKKLEWLNGGYIRKSQISPFNKFKVTSSEIERSNLKSQIYDFYQGKYPQDFIEKTIPLVQERIKKLSEYEGLVDFLAAEELTGSEESKKLLLSQNHQAFEVKTLLSTLNSQLSVLKNGDWQASKLDLFLHKLLTGQFNAWRPREFFMTVRIAISGKTVGPPLFESLEILGKGKTLARLQTANTQLQP